MSSTPTVLRGTVRGKTIELEAESGLPEGQQVTVTLEPAPQQQTAADSPLEALKRAAGSWSDDPEALDLPREVLHARASGEGHRGRSRQIRARDQRQDGQLRRLGGLQGPAQVLSP